MRQAHFFKAAIYRGILGMGLLLVNCPAALAASSATSDNDPHSFANTNEVTVTHLDLDIVVNFSKREISGRARLFLNHKSRTDQLILDARDLAIERVTLDDAQTPTAYEVGQALPYLGQPLSIKITPGTQFVDIYYRTDPKAEALQWLSPEQTSGKRHPFLFTQSEAVLARTWIPCQDSPGVRMTYNARVKVPPGLLAVMSARNGTEKNADGVYEFEMTQPIPSYLLALAVGDIEFRSLGPRSGVYAEPQLIDKAVYEFADTEKMMAAAEALYGPYRWGRYDIIVLPPSFPYGGMENPRLTFATPTVLTGDRSLVALVAHELAHSWSGNLVTNATWNDFWLNEGFTSYLEIRIMEKIYGKAYAGMLAHLSYQDALEEIEKLGADNRDTHLYIDLSGRNPDDSPSGVVYDKGRLFLQLLEESVGRERWDAFLNRYFDSHAFQSITTAEFLRYLRKHLIKDDPALEKKVKINAWVYGPGLPDNCPASSSPEFQRVEEQLQAWSQGTPATKLNTENWTTHHWLHFLRNLPEKMSGDQMADLDAAFDFTHSGNAEIAFAWYEHVIANRYTPAYQALENFLTRVGRQKFLKPLYEELAKTPEGLAQAREIYKKARPGYHPVTCASIDDVLGYQE